MRVLDSKEKEDQAIADEAGGVLLDNLSKDSKAYFTKVLEYLDDMGVKYELNPRLVRGLDYYTHTVFEIADSASGLILGGGGRYDGLMKILGGPDTPAIGWTTSPGDSQSGGPNHHRIKSQTPPSLGDPRWEQRRDSRRHLVDVL